jgi:hypothetical protein
MHVATAFETPYLFAQAMAFISIGAPNLRCLASVLRDKK